MTTDERIRDILDKLVTLAKADAHATHTYNACGSKHDYIKMNAANDALLEGLDEAELAILNILAGDK